MLKTNLKNILYLVIGLVLGFAVARVDLNRQNRYTVTEITPTPQATAIAYPDLEYYESLLKSKGLITRNIQLGNLTSKGEQIIFTEIGEGCGSCHYNEIHIFDNKKEIFVFYGEDTNLYAIDGLGFDIVQPVYKNGYGVPTEYQSARYSWNGKTFIKTETSPNWIDSPQTPG